MHHSHDCLSCIAGLTTEQAEESFLLEASQGDSISGKITREEAASVVAAALNTPASKGKVFFHSTNRYIHKAEKAIRVHL